MILAIIVAYSAGLVALGWRVSRGVRRAEDFYVAGRSLSPPLLFASFLAANLGAGTTVGAAGLGYQYGLSAWWWVGSAAMGTLILGWWIGPKLYRIAARHDLLTVGDYLELRYSRAVRLLVAVILWFASLSILAGQLIAAGTILEAVTRLPQVGGCVLAGLIVTLYFSAGGLVSSAWVNLFQVCVKAAAFCVAVPWALSEVGGWQGIASAAAARPAIDETAYMSITGIGAAGVLHYVILLVPAFFVSPGLLQKAYGARDERTVRRAVTAQGLCLLGYAFFPVLLGMVAFVRFPQLATPDLALPVLMAEGMPPILGGLMLAAIFSAEISSADAVLFMISTSVARDFAQGTLRKSLDGQALLRLTRIVAFIAGLGGVILALWLRSVVAALEIFYSLLVVTLFVPLVAGLYSRRPRAAHAIVSMLVAIPVTLLVRYGPWGQELALLSPAAAGIVVSGIVFEASRLMKRKAKSRIMSGLL